MIVLVALWLHGSIVVGWLFVISTLVAHISLRMSFVEVTPVAVVGVDIESPRTVMPGQRTIEVREFHIFLYW